MPEAASPTPSTQAQSATGGQIQLTPELVKKIAARVYALMMADLRIERERRRSSSKNLRSNHGGRYGF